MRTKKIGFGKIQLTLSQRELDIIYASMQWNMDNETIDTEDWEFDQITGELYPLISQKAKELIVP